MCPIDFGMETKMDVVFSEGNYYSFNFISLEETM